MTYEEIIRKLRKYVLRYDATEIEGHLAIQFNIYGEGEGALYIEVSDGRIDIQPYEYYDRDALIYIDAKTLLEVASGTLSMKAAYDEKRFVVQGRHDAVLEFGKMQLVEKKRVTKHLRTRRLIRLEPQGRRHQTVLNRRNR